MSARPSYVERGNVNGRRYTERYSLPDELETALRKAIGRRSLPDSFYISIASALDAFVRREEPRASQQRRETVTDLQRAVRLLQQRIRHADVIFPIAGPAFLSSSWRTLAGPLAQLDEQLNGWLQLHPDGGNGRRGRPRHGLLQLRLCVLWALGDLGMSLDPADHAGPAARALAVVLAAAQQQDVYTVKPRDWRRWVTQWRAVAAMRPDLSR